MDIPQLRNHIPIAGPARREPVDGSETDLRVSIGFEPAWSHKRCGVEFTEHWHKDPYYRYKSLEIMKAELVNSFPAASHWDLRRIFEDTAPCDVVVADIQHTTPDWKINSLFEICRTLEEDLQD
jgi:hypothetical protein